MSTKWAWESIPGVKQRPQFGMQISVKHIVCSAQRINILCLARNNKSPWKMMNENLQSLNYISWGIKFNPSKRHVRLQDDLAKGLTLHTQFQISSFISTY